MLPGYSFLEIQNLSIFLESRISINHVDLIIQEKSKVGIVGATGSGKTTLLKAIAGLVQIEKGNIWFNQAKIKGPDEQLIPGNKMIGYLSQYSELRNNYRVQELLEFHNHLSSEKIQKFCDICAIGHLTERWTDELSGGEKQRIALALLLMSEPKVLLLDEPYSNLDNIHKEQMKLVIDQLSNKLNISCIMVSHDIPDLLLWADEIIVMKQGRVIQKGDPESIYNKPSTIYCAGIMGPYQLFDKSLAKNLLLPIPDFPSEKKLLIRPSFLGLEKNSTNESSYAISSIEFKGNYHLIGIKSNEGEFKCISTPYSGFAIGDKVNLKYLPNHFTFI